MRMLFGAYDRLSVNDLPRFSCPNLDDDLYTMSGNARGNGLANTPAGLLTADEATYAGISIASSPDTYLNNSLTSWTASPYTFTRTDNNEMWALGAGWLGATIADCPYGVRPVVSLKSDVLATGTGTSDDPYVITE